MVTKFFSSFGYVLNGQVIPIQSWELVYQAPERVDPVFNNLLKVTLQTPVLFDGAPQHVITTPSHIVVLFPPSYPNYIRREFEKCE